MAKDWYKSRTLWLNIGVLFVAALDAAKVLPSIPSDWAPYIVIIEAFVNGVLRLLTGQPIAGTPAANPPAPLSVT